jgi:hypothetical protein
MEKLYHGAYRPGTVDLDTSGAADYEALRHGVYRDYPYIYMYDS